MLDAQLPVLAVVLERGHKIPVHGHGQNPLSTSQGVVPAGTVLTHTCGAKPWLLVKSDRRLPACNFVCCCMGNVWLIGL